MEEGVDEEDEAPEDNSQLTLAQLRTSFKTSILQYIQPVQWGLCLETGTRLVSSKAYVNITHLCRDDLVNLFTDIFKLSKSKYLLFGNEGFLENKVGEQLNNTGVVQGAFKGAIARYKTWATTGLKLVNRNSIDVSFNEVQELLSDSLKEMAETRKYYAANPSNLKAREEYRHASHLVRYIRNRIQNECSAKHRRKLEDAMIVYARQHNFGSFRYDSVKLGAVHAEDTELFKSRMGSFHSPDVWITNPSKAVQSAFRNAFGTSRLLLSSDPGGRTVETQMASTGHVVQIGVGFEAVICRLQKRISTLQSFRDRAIDQIDTVIVLRSRVAAAELDLVKYASGDQVVAKETLRLENLVLAAEQELEARLKELRTSARM
ncbi:hypothetical protein HDU79_000798, partial [Rhizoclosmatium sp. JEL0117]